MIGFHDHVTDPRSGRPEPHVSWAVESFKTWATWLAVLMALVAGGFYYNNFHDGDGAARFIFFGVMLGGIAYYRRVALKRKKLALQRAIECYEKMLSKPAG